MRVTSPDLDDDAVVGSGTTQAGLPPRAAEAAPRLVGARLLVVGARHQLAVPANHPEHRIDAGATLIIVVRPVGSGRSRDRRGSSPSSREPTLGTQPVSRTSSDTAGMLKSSSRADGTPMQLQVNSHGTPQVEFDAL